MQHPLISLLCFFLFLEHCEISKVLWTPLSLELNTNSYRVQSEKILTCLILDSPWTIELLSLKVSSVEKSKFFPVMTKVFRIDIKQRLTAFLVYQLFFDSCGVTTNTNNTIERQMLLQICSLEINAASTQCLAYSNDGNLLYYMRICSLISSNSMGSREGLMFENRI